MTDVTDKFLKLMNELKRATIEGRISWEETADEEEFRAVLKPGMVRVGRRPAYDADDEATTVFAITLLNQEGRVVEEFVAHQPASLEPAEELFELARRTALKGEKLLDDFLADLEKRLVKHL